MSKSIDVGDDVVSVESEKYDFRASFKIFSD